MPRSQFSNNGLWSLCSAQRNYNEFPLPSNPEPCLHRRVLSTGSQDVRMVTHLTIWEAILAGPGVQGWSGIQKDYLNQKDKQSIIRVERVKGWAGAEAVAMACEFNSDNSDELYWLGAPRTWLPYLTAVTKSDPCGCGSWPLHLEEHCSASLCQSKVTFLTLPASHTAVMSS